METLNYQITEDEHIKSLVSKEYNYVYNKDLMTFLRWGKNKNDNPVWAPFGPEYININVQNMSMELFTVIIDTLNTNRTLATVNLIGPLEPSDEYKIQYCLSKGITPLLNIDTETNEDAGFFSASIDNEGIVRPAPSYPNGINIMDVENFFVDIWNSPIFKKYRWEKLQQS